MIPLGLRKPAERYDADAGLQYLNARYYDPRLGLFLQPDWFEVTQTGVGTNRYSYSGNDPVNSADPGGNVRGNYDDDPTDNEAAADSDGWTYTNSVNEDGSIAEKGFYYDGRDPDAAHSKYSVTYKTYDDDVVTTHRMDTGIVESGDLIFNLFSGGSAAVVRGIGNIGLQAISRRATNNLWNMPPVARGRTIEQMLGQNLPSNFPGIDKLGQHVATSIKSLELGGPTYQNASRLLSKVTSYVDNVRGFRAGSLSGINAREGIEFTSRTLELAVPSSGNAAQRQALKDAADYAASVGVRLVERIIK